MIAQSAPYVIGIMVCIILIGIMSVAFDSKQFKDTFRAYWLHSGIWSATAWAMLFILRGGK